MLDDHSRPKKKKYTFFLNVYKKVYAYQCIQKSIH